MFLVSLNILNIMISSAFAYNNIPQPTGYFLFKYIYIYLHVTHHTKLKQIGREIEI